MQNQAISIPCMSAHRHTVKTNMHSILLPTPHLSSCLIVFIASHLGIPIKLFKIATTFRTGHQIIFSSPLRAELKDFEIINDDRGAFSEVPLCSIYSQEKLWNPRWGECGGSQAGRRAVERNAASIGWLYIILGKISLLAPLHLNCLQLTCAQRSPGG